MKKQAVWEYIGDVRCPCCQSYSKTYGKGHNNNRLLRLQCRRTGKVYMRSPYSFWKLERDFDMENDTYRRILREELETKGQIAVGTCNG